MKFWAWVAGGLVALIGAALALLFVVDALPVFRHSGFGAYLFGSEWFYRAERFGILSMLYGTLAVAAVALAVATPVGLGTAIFLAEAPLPRRSRLLIKSVVELLAGIPSVVYGLLGVLVLREVVFRFLAPWEPLSGDTLLTAGLLLAVMTLPTFVTLADDALRGVPAVQREAGRALGFSRGEVVRRVALPQALPGLVAAGLLALGRALGETIAVFLVVGRQDNQLPSPWWSPAPLAASGQTLTSKLGGAETFLAYDDPLHWGAMSGLALVLVLLVTATTLIGGRLLVGRGGIRAARG
ncbi:MAG: phosphate ABC transporter permease subunit PstC [Thermoanaerobaculia bacterium]|nr:phosphate ABC transporter permease subunit PstC [Thermoanaerobaculia bacterium]